MTVPFTSLFHVEWRETSILLVDAKDAADVSRELCVLPAVGLHGDVVRKTYVRECPVISTIGGSGLLSIRSSVCHFGMERNAPDSPRKDVCRDVAQLVERTVRDREAEGSSPFVPTTVFFLLPMACIGLPCHETSPSPPFSCSGPDTFGVWSGRRSSAA